MKAIRPVQYLFALVLIQGCAGLNSGENERIDQLVIVNQTEYLLKDVILSVPDKNIIVSANAILPYRNYTLGFPERENRRERAVLSWWQNGQQYRREIEIEIPQNPEKSLVYTAVVTISDNGKMTSILQPHSANSGY